MSEALTRKQALFVAEYLVDLNAGQAAIAAAQAPRLKLDADAVLIELARIARANVLDCIRFGDDGAPIVDLSQLDRDQAAGLSELTIEEVAAGSRGRPAVKRTKFRMHDKLAALDKLARHFGLLRERAATAAEPAAHDEDGHDPRQVARAVFQILQSAQLADEAKETETIR